MEDIKNIEFDQLFNNVKNNPASFLLEKKMMEFFDIEQLNRFKDWMENDWERNLYEFIDNNKLNEDKILDFLNEENKIKSSAILKELGLSYENEQKLLKMNYVLNGYLNEIEGTIKSKELNNKFKEAMNTKDEPLIDFDLLELDDKKENNYL